MPISTLACDPPTPPLRQQSLDQGQVGLEMAHLERQEGRRTRRRRGNMCWGSSELGMEVEGDKLDREVEQYLRWKTWDVLSENMV